MNCLYMQAIKYYPYLWVLEGGKILGAIFILIVAKEEVICLQKKEEEVRV